MATYPGMNLSGEIRESVSLDEDDLSDVEDEVFIRDGKARFKYSEDIGLKRPLMAPRRKLTKPDFKSRLRNRPPCRPYCKPFCYICGGLLVIMGTIVLVVIIASMFPLPIDKMRNWIVAKTKETSSTRASVVKPGLALPCSELKVTNVWSQTLPKLTSETSIRPVDVNADGVDDVIFGFATGDSRALPDEIFCPMFMDVAGPCGGGVLALNGLNGEVLWKKHLAYAAFTIFCSNDLNGDNVNDCIVTGDKGMLLTINAKDGSTFWEFNDTDKGSNLKFDIYEGNFIPDQDNDNVADILVAHTMQKDTDNEDEKRLGQVILISGKSGKEIKRVSTPNNIETHYIPQLLPQKDGRVLILLGTGSPRSSGNLTTISLADFVNGNASFTTIFEHKLSGVISPSVLVDITGDQQLDIVVAMFNTTVVAIDGATFKQIWNVTVNNSETLSIPTPGYFNDDNVTDFLVKYQTGPGFPVYYYSQTFVIDGKTGEIINSSRVDDNMGSQMGGVTLSTEKHGNDFFLYWIAHCKHFEERKDKFAFLNGATLVEQDFADLCRLRFNSTKVTKLFALNQFDQPPGMEVYSSDSMIDIEYNNSKSPLDEAVEYLKKHPEVQVLKTPEYDSNLPFRAKMPTGRMKTSSFRHKFDQKGLVKSYNKQPNRPNPNAVDDIDYDGIPENWKMNYPKGLQPQTPDVEYGYEGYDEMPPRLYNENKNVFNLNNRDTRGDENETPQLYDKKLAKNGIYDYKNIKQSGSRLLNDLNSSPTEILKDTYFKNLEHQLRKSRFEQRDLKSHKTNEDIAKVIETEKQKALNVSVNLWDLETEKEIEDRKYGYARGKRSANLTQTGVPMISSIGVLVPTLEPTMNAVDLIFLTYWTPSKPGSVILIEEDLKCVEDKMIQVQKTKATEMEAYETNELQLRFQKECLSARGAFQAAEADNVEEVEVAGGASRNKADIPYRNEIAAVNLGQMTVYRVRVECARCNVQSAGERCAKFLNPAAPTVWSAYLNRRGDGVFAT